MLKCWNVYQEDTGILENIALLLDILQGIKDLVDRREKGVNKEHQQAFSRVSVLQSCKCEHSAG